jgi:peptide/nickel transport system substrate-binding protein
VRLARDGLYEWTAYGEPASEPVLEVTTGPHVESVHYRVYGTQATGVLALQAGQVDYLFNPLGLERGFQDQLRDVPGVTLIENATNGIRYLAFNLRREPMSRLAVPAGGGHAHRSRVRHRPRAAGRGRAALQCGAARQRRLAQSRRAGVRAGLSRGDRIREAVRLLEADGFSWAQRPVVDAAGTLVTPGRGSPAAGGQPVAPLELLGPGEAYDPLRATFASWTERWLNEVGIPVRPVLTAFNAVSDRVFDRQDFDMYILGWSLTIYPSYLESFFHSRYTGLRGHNAAGLREPRIRPARGGVPLRGRRHGACP